MKNGIPAYAAPDGALNAMAALKEYNLIKKSGIAEEESCIGKTDKEAALKIIKKARKDGRDALTEIEAKQVFEAYDLPITKSRLATSEKEAVSIAKEFGYPVVMKIVSPDILHT